MNRTLVVMGMGLMLGGAAAAQDAPAPGIPADVAAPAVASTDSAPASAAQTSDAAPADATATSAAPEGTDAGTPVPPPPPVDAPPPPPPQSPDELKLSMSPLYAGAYVAPMFSYSKLAHDWESKNGLGGELALGYRLKEHGFGAEVRGVYSTIGSSRAIEGGTLNALIFPFAGNAFADGLYFVGGGGYLRSSKHPQISGSFGTTALQIGAGYMLGLKFGGYDFGVRAEALGRHEERSQVDRNDADGGPRTFNDVVFNIGLQLPLGRPHEAPPAPEPPVTVVPPVVNSAPVAPPKPQCRKPEPGEKLTLDGCGAGDVIVLNGVNFDFNKATLTANAQTILDQVTAELSAHPDIKVELAGHTDSRGSDAYNLKLSQARAESVRSYFVTHGIAADRMTAVGYGETQPIASNDTDDGREHNRRVELRITSADSATPVVTPDTSSDANPPTDAAAPAAMPSQP